MDGSAGRLAEGIDLPVSFYELAIAEARGPRGGQKLTMSGLRERWLTNEAFVELVGSGLIGSRTADTAAITKQIRVRAWTRTAQSPLQWVVLRVG